MSNQSKRPGRYITDNQKPLKRINTDTLGTSGSGNNLVTDLNITGSLCLSKEEIMLTDSYVAPSLTVINTYYTLTGGSLSGSMTVPTADGCVKNIFLSDVPEGENLVITFGDNELKSPSGYTLAQKAVFDRKGNSLRLVSNNGIWYVLNAECCLVDINFIAF